jgi:hypothetical protein
VHDAHPLVRISGTVPRYTALADAGQYIDGIGAGIKEGYSWALFVI